MDLGKVLPLGEVSRERRDLPLGDRNAPEFVSGWSWPEKDAKGRAFRWATGDRSSLRFYCASPREIQLRLTIRPFVYEGAPEQVLRCLLNGAAIGEKKFPSVSHLDFQLPPSLLHEGENHLDFLWKYSTRVSDVRPSRDQRKLAAAVSAILFEGLVENPTHRGIAQDGPVRLPGASETRIALRPGPDAVLNLAAGELKRLKIRVRQEGEEARTVEASGRRGGLYRLKNHEGPIEIAFRVGRGAPLSLDDARLSWAGPDISPASESEPSVRRPDIILYVVDTLRADRLACYGGPEGISPAVDRLSADGLLYEHAVAQSSWTKPSVTSILSGLLSTEHGVRSREQAIPKRVKLISEYLKDSGYRTGAFTTNAYLIPAAGFDRGFEDFHFSQISSRKLTREGIGWLSEQGKDKPVFLWLHSVDPHAPYQPTAAFRGRWAPGVPAEFGSVEHIRSLGGRPPEETAPFVSPFRALYDAELAQNDAALGELIGYLRKSGRYDDSCIVFVSDHGEEFWEHGVNGHGWDLFEEVLHVPLVLKLPGSSRRGDRVPVPVQQIDLLPTLLHIAGLRVPENLRGRDLFAGGPDPDRPIFSEMSYEGREGFAVRSGSYKLIQPLSRGFLPGPQLFDLEADSGESINYGGDFPVLAAWLALEGRMRMALLPASGEAERPVALSAEERRGLEALGYLKARPEGN